MSDEELANLYRNALALVAPSLMEGFGLPVLEAMSLTCLVLASDIPSFREVANDAVIYFDPYSTDDLKEKLRFVFAISSEEKKKYIESGMQRVRKFSWSRMARETLSVYEGSVSLRQGK